MTKIKKPPEIETTEIVSERLICESCGKDFSCGARVGECWCFAVDVKAETLAELHEDFKNCLCEDCLAKVSKEKIVHGK